MDYALELIGKLDDAARDKQPRHELDSLFDALVEAYAELPEDERKQVRAAYIRCTRWGTSDFWFENQSYNLRFEETGCQEDLRRALAHYSLNNGFPDARDAMLAINDLHAAARQHGLDRCPVFSEIAAITNAEGPWALQRQMRIVE